MLFALSRRRRFESVRCLCGVFSRFFYVRVFSEDASQGSLDKVTQKTLRTREKKKKTKKTTKPEFQSRSSYFCLIFAFLVAFSFISLTLYRSDLPPARSVRILIVSSLCLTFRI